MGTVGSHITEQLREYHSGCEGDMKILEEMPPSPIQ